jgi:hypothetical protein
VPFQYRYWQGRKNAVEGIIIYQKPMPVDKNYVFSQLRGYFYML